MVVIALALATAIGFLAMRLALPPGPGRPRWARWTFEISLGVAAGAAITSTLFLLLRAAGVQSRAVQGGAEGLLLAALLFLVWRRRAAEADDEPAPPSFRYTWLLAVALGIASLFVVAMDISVWQHSRWGQWDAFAIYNLRAKFLLSAGDLWLRAASPLLEHTHWEYPLGLPLFVARTWLFDGDLTSPAAGFATGLFFFWALLALAISGLALVRGAAAGLLGGLLLLSSLLLLDHSTWQYADVPMALYCLAAFILALMSDSVTSARTRFLVMAGVAMGLAAWTKNEGLAFLAALLAGYTVVTWRLDGFSEALRRGKWLLAGTVPGLALLAAFHFLILKGSGAAAGQSFGQAMAKMGEWSRYTTILSAAFRDTLAMGVGIAHPLILIGVLAFLLRFEIDPRHRRFLFAGAASVVLLIGAYAVTYLTTTDDLPWRLETSLQRLYTQVWPLAVFLAMLVLRPPADPTAAEPQKKTAAAKKRKGKHRRA